MSQTRRSTSFLDRVQRGPDLRPISGEKLAKVFRLNSYYPLKLYVRTVHVWQTRGLGHALVGEGRAGDM